MAKKEIIITLPHPRPCRFDGMALEVQSELIPKTVKEIAESLRNFIGQFLDTSSLEAPSEPRIKLALYTDHYRAYIIIEIDESTKCGEREIQKFLSHLFNEEQAGIFESTLEQSEIPSETENIIREEAQRARVSLGGMALMEEATISVGEKQIFVAAGKIKRPPAQPLAIDPTPRAMTGSVSGYCRFERVIYFVKKDSKKRAVFNYDPTHLHETVSRIASNVFNYVEIVIQEFSAGNGKVAVTVTAVNELKKDPSSLF